MVIDYASDLSFLNDMISGTHCISYLRWNWTLRNYSFIRIFCSCCCCYCSRGVVKPFILSVIVFPISFKFFHSLYVCTIKVPACATWIEILILHFPNWFVFKGHKFNFLFYDPTWQNSSCCYKATQWHSPVSGYTQGAGAKIRFDLAVVACELRTAALY